MPRPIMKALLRIACSLLLISASFDAAAADTIVRDLPPGLHVPADARPGPGFDIERATEAWLGLLSPEQRALSDAYFEGGYWLKLWSLLYGLGVMAILLGTGLSRHMRDFAERAGRRPWLAVAIYGGLFIVATFALDLPLSIYRGFVREHQYGLSNLTLSGWLHEKVIGLALSVVLGSVVLSVFYAVMRRAGQRWWVWATGFAFGFTLLLDLIYPVFIAPLFNDYKPLPEGPVRDTVLSLARAPFNHTVVRSVEAEADAFGLNAAREPEGFAMAAMRLSTYRKLKPGPVEEFIFYDHPSGYDRVRRSMIWLKENQNATPSSLLPRP